MQREWCQASVERTEKFSPDGAVTARSCAVTAPKVTELRRSVTSLGSFPF